MPPPKLFKSPSFVVETFNQAAFHTQTPQLLLHLLLCNGPTSPNSWSVSWAHG